MSIKNRFKNSIGLKFLSGFLLIFAILIFTLLWGGSSSLPIINMNSDVLERTQNISATGGTLKFTEDDFNYMLRLLDTQDIKRGDITIRGVYVKLGKEDITGYIPVKLKGIGMLLSGKASITYSGSIIKLKPLSFKLGLIPIPKNIVIGLLKKFNNKYFSISKDEKSLLMDEKSLPVAVTSIAIKERSIFVDIPKINIENKINKIIDDESKALGIKSNENPTENNSTKGISGQINKNGNRKTKNKKSNDSRKVILSRASSQLASAESVVKSSGGKRIIAIAKGTVNKMIANPSYKYQRDIMTAKSIYDKLSASDKEKVKAAILTKVDTKALMKVYTNKK